MSKSYDYDNACGKITDMLVFMSQWKHNYLGAAYTTRLKQLRTDMQKTLELLDKTIEEDTIVPEG